MPDDKVPMVKAQMYVSKALWAEFQALCKLKHTSASAVLREAMRAVIARMEQDPDLTVEEQAGFEAYLDAKYPQRKDH